MINIKPGHAVRLKESATIDLTQFDEITVSTSDIMTVDSVHEYECGSRVTVIHRNGMYLSFPIEQLIPADGEIANNDATIIYPDLEISPRVQCVHYEDGRELQFYVRDTADSNMLGDFRFDMPDKPHYKVINRNGTDVFIVQRKDIQARMDKLMAMKYSHSVLMRTRGGRIYGARLYKV